MTISYNGNVIRILLRWKGSIWRTVWKELVIYLILFYSVRIVYMRGFEAVLDDDDDAYKYRHKFEAFCRMCDSYTRLIPLTFLLGFYVSNVVARWWRQFETLYWPEDILSILCTVLHQQDEKNKKRRHTIARYLNLSCALAWRDISSKIRLRFPNVKSLINTGLLTEKEYNILESLHEECDAARWMTPIHWIQHIMREVEEENKPTASLLNHFVGELRIFRQSLRKLYSYDWVCVPLVYTQVAALATYAFFFFTLFGRQTLIPDIKSGKEVDIFVPVFTIVQFMFFIGWFKVGQDLMRPFGLDDDDIELNYIFDRNVRISFAIVNRLQSFPCPDYETDDGDILWSQSENGSILPIPHSKYSRQLSEHPPRLHAYVPIADHPKDDESSNGCIKVKKDKRFINW